MLHFVLVFVTAVVFFIRDHKIRRQRGRKLGGIGRGRRRKARKIALRTLMEYAVCSITGFWFISENMASFRDILKLLLESADDDDISKDEFLLLYDRNISKNPDFPYDCCGAFYLNEMDDSKCLAEFLFHQNVVPLLLVALQLP